MVGQQFGLISALQKLGAYNQRIPSNIPQTTSALCIVKPLFGGGSVWSSLFSTHPPAGGSHRRAARNDHQPTGMTALNAPHTSAFWQG